MITGANSLNDEEPVNELTLAKNETSDANDAMVSEGKGGETLSRRDGEKTTRRPKTRRGLVEKRRAQSTQHLPGPKPKLDVRAASLPRSTESTKQSTIGSLPSLTGKTELTTNRTVIQDNAGSGYRIIALRQLGATNGPTTLTGAPFLKGQMRDRSKRPMAAVRRCPEDLAKIAQARRLMEWSRVKKELSYSTSSDNNTLGSQPYIKILFHWCCCATKPDAVVARSKVSAQPDRTARLSKAQLHFMEEGGDAVGINNNKNKDGREEKTVDSPTTNGAKGGRGIFCCFGFQNCVGPAEQNQKRKERKEKIKETKIEKISIIQDPEKPPVQFITPQKQQNEPKLGARESLPRHQTNIVRISLPGQVEDTDSHRTILKRSGKIYSAKVDGHSGTKEPFPRHPTTPVEVYLPGKVGPMNVESTVVHRNLLKTSDKLYSSKIDGPSGMDDPFPRHPTTPVEFFLPGQVGPMNVESTAVHSTLLKRSNKMYSGNINVPSGPQDPFPRRLTSTTRVRFALPGEIGATDGGDTDWNPYVLKRSAKMYSRHFGGSSGADDLFPRHPTTPVEVFLPGQVGPMNVESTAMHSTLLKRSSKMYSGNINEPLGTEDPFPRRQTTRVRFALPGKIGATDGGGTYWNPNVLKRSAKMYSRHVGGSSGADDLFPRHPTTPVEVFLPGQVGPMNVESTAMHSTLLKRSNKMYSGNINEPLGTEDPFPRRQTTRVRFALPGKIGATDGGGTYWNPNVLKRSAKMYSRHVGGSSGADDLFPRHPITPVEVFLTEQVRPMNVEHTDVYSTPLKRCDKIYSGLSDLDRTKKNLCLPGQIMEESEWATVQPTLRVYVDNDGDKKTKKNPKQIKLGKVTITWNGCWKKRKQNDEVRIQQEPYISPGQIMDEPEWNTMQPTLRVLDNDGDKKTKKKSKQMKLGKVTITWNGCWKKRKRNDEVTILPRQEPYVSPDQIMDEPEWKIMQPTLRVLDNDGDKKKKKKTKQMKVGKVTWNGCWRKRKGNDEVAEILQQEPYVSPGHIMDEPEWNAVQPTLRVLDGDNKKKEKPKQMKLGKVIITWVGCCKKRKPNDEVAALLQQEPYVLPGQIMDEPVMNTMQPTVPRLDNNGDKKKKKKPKQIKLGKVTITWNGCCKKRKRNDEGAVLLQQEPVENVDHKEHKKSTRPLQSKQ